MNLTPRTAYLLSFAAAAALSGCGSEVTVDDPRLDQIDATLVRAESCEDLESKVRADALARVDRQMDAMLLMADQFDQRNDSPFGGNTEGDFDGGDGGELAGSDGSSESTGSGTPTSGNGDSGRDAPAPPDYSKTNNQVEGIDEADIVKTDGLNLYVLHGSEFSILKAWPAAELAVSQSLALEGTPIEMFVEGGKAVIFVRADGDAIYQAAGVTPKPAYNGNYGGYYGEGDYGDCYEGCGAQNPLTQVVVLDISSGSPTVEREFFFEGDYLSSRREGNEVRVVLSGGAHLPAVNVYPDCGGGGCNDGDDWRDAVESARSSARIMIASAKLDEFIPYRFQRDAGTVSQLSPGCDGYWVPTSGSSEYGLTQVETFDLGDIAKGPSETAIVGAVQTVYANGESLILAGQSYDTSRFVSGIAANEEFMVNTTYLHKFSVSGGSTNYQSSVTVPGMLIEQFAIDEKDGVIRVATHTTKSTGDSWSEANALYTAQPDASNDLQIIGRIENIAPDEQMYAVRFLGDRGYFVTFLQVDPLFVFDLSNPSAPLLKGELKIPGFSEYMHPIDDGHLLTVGIDDGGWGLALQIFDVTDDLNPKLAHKLSLGDASSEALYQHKAFTFWRDMLAIPVQGWSGDTYQAGLSLFGVDVVNGFTEKGTIDHSELFDIDAEYNYCSPGGVRRGVFIEDFIYSVSDGGVLVHDVADLSVPVASADFSFDATASCDQYYY